MKCELRRRETMSKTISEHTGFLFAVTEWRTAGERFAENSETLKLKVDVD